MTAAVLPDLSGSRVQLRRPSDDDIDALVRLPIDPGIVRMYGLVHNGPRLRTQGDAERVVRWMRAEPYLWVIDVDGHYVGHVRLHTVKATDERASLAIGIDDAGRLGQGLGTQAIRLVLGHAFGTMRLHRVSVRVIAYNARAISAYEKCGFVREGVEREAAHVGGVRHDDVIMGVLADEYRHLEKPP